MWSILICCAYTIIVALVGMSSGGVFDNFNNNVKMIIKIIGVICAIFLIVSLSFAAIDTEKFCNITDNQAVFCEPYRTAKNK